MAPDFVYSHGLRAYNEGISLSGNPYNIATSPAAHEAWKDGWLDASRARGRRLRALAENASRAMG